MTSVSSKTPTAMIATSALLLAIGCPRQVADGPAPAADAKPTTDTKVADKPDAEEVDAQGPVYALAADTPLDPRALALCKVLHDDVAARRGACCKRTRPQAYAGEECARNLTAALLGGGVTLDAPGVAACGEAMKEATTGCGWVSPRPGVVPAACLDVVRGTRGKGARCRSHLACEGGLRCVGLTAVQPGRCRAPAATGSGCAPSTDPLAVFLRQSDVELEHPPCEGYCARGRCQPRSAIGAACKSSLHCGAGAFCDGELCRKGEQKAGGACADGGCAPGLRCLDHLCVEPLAEGAVCANDFQCLGSCNKASGAAEGVCGMRCASRLP